MRLKFMHTQTSIDIYRGKEVDFSGCLEELHVKGKDCSIVPEPPATAAHALSQEKATEDGPAQDTARRPLQGFSCLNHHGSTSRKEDVSKETVEAFHQGGCMKALKLVRVTKSSSLDNVEKGSHPAHWEPMSSAPVVVSRGLE
ncbi:uncharacterized protein LJ206_008341 isoform 1-T1 [Theristicus caerulescens]